MFQTRCSTTIWKAYDKGLKFYRVEIQTETKKFVDEICGVGTRIFLYNSFSLRCRYFICIEECQFPDHYFRKKGWISLEFYLANIGGPGLIRWGLKKHCLDPLTNFSIKTKQFDSHSLSASNPLNLSTMSPAVWGWPGQAVQNNQIQIKVTVSHSFPKLECFKSRATVRTHMILILYHCAH